MRIRLVIAAIFVIAVVGEQSAKAGVIYNNLGAATNGDDPISDFGPLADSFSTGASATQLSDVQVLLSNGSGSTGSITIFLLRDSSTSPGAVLATLGTLSDSAATLGPSIYDFSLASPYALAANTRYWIELSSTNGSHLTWDWSVDTSGIGVEKEFFANQGGVFPNDPNGPYQMLLSSTAVPEPSSLALCGIAGLGGLAYQARRRRRDFTT